MKYYDSLAGLYALLPIIALLVLLLLFAAATGMEVDLGYLPEIMGLIP